MKRTLEIGALCDPISKQLAGMLLAEDADQLDRDNDAITRCNLMGYMPDSTTERARKRLLKKTQAAARRFAEAYNAHKANIAGQGRPERSEGRSL